MTAVVWLSTEQLYGGGPPYLRTGRKITYREDRVLEWIDQQEFGSTSEYPPRVGLPRKR
jgi:hypothetical protein